MQDNLKATEHIIGSAVMDKNYAFTIADEGIYAFLGAKVVPLFTAHIHPDDRDAFVDAVKNCTGENGVNLTIRVKNCLDEYCLAIMFLKSSTLDPEKFITIDIYDIIHLVHEYNALNSNFKKLTYTMQLMDPAILFNYDPKTKKIVVYTDRDVIDFDGDIDELRKKMIDAELVDKMHISGFNKLIDDVKNSAAGVRCILNLNLRSLTNKIVTASVRTAPIYDKDSAEPVAIVGVVSPVEAVVDNTDKVYNNPSNLDPLTGLYNKAAIKEMAIDAIANTNEVINYVMLDLDHFKEVNDTYGHMFGDEVILNAARIIKDVVGRKGFVGRVGGDEFFIVLKGIGSELDDLRPILRAIRAQIEWAYKGKLGGIKLTTSIGCASYPKDADNYDDLFKLADRCLYFAKTKGRNRFIIYVKEFHGSLDEIKDSDNSIKMERTMTDVQRLEFVTDAVNRLSDWRQNIITPVLKDMMEYFSIDEVVVYDVASGKAVYSPSAELFTEEENVCTYFNEFKSVFRETNIFSYGDSINLKIPYPDFYEYTRRKGYLSLFVFAIKDKGDITHLLAAYATVYNVKWSDLAVNCLSILSKTIGDKIIH